MLPHPTRAPPGPRGPPAGGRRTRRAPPPTPRLAAPPRPRPRALLQPHLRLAARVEPVRDAHAPPAADGTVVVGEAQAVAHRELAPVARVAVLLELVRARDRRRRPDLGDPLRAVDRAGALPRGEPGL